MTHQKRCCIVGTAQTWTLTPWSDPTLEIWSLNDAYVMGLPRTDRWFELHPLDKMWYRKPQQRMIDPRQVPEGYYIRPEGHHDWLRRSAKTIPVYLQNDPPEGWPVNAQRFPLERITSVFGESYWACGPSYMLALAWLEGYTDIWITGIHLATQQEYLEQRPQFENLIGRLLGPNVRESVRDGFRFYEGLVRIVLPVASPILQHGWRYAFESRPAKQVNPYEDELKAVRKEKQALIDALVAWPVGKDKSRQIARLERLAVIELDIQNVLARRNIGGTLVARIAA